MKILIVDDNGINLKVLGTTLTVVSKKLDITVELIEAVDGENALALFKEHADFDMVLTDVRMPIMDGVELCHEIRKIDPYIRITLVSAELPECVSTGITKILNLGFISKPVSQEVIANALAPNRKLEKKDSDTKPW